MKRIYEMYLKWRLSSIEGKIKNLQMGHTFIHSGGYEEYEKENSTIVKDGLTILGNGIQKLYKKRNRLENKLN